MNFTIEYTPEPCDQIEHWQAAVIHNNENTNTAPACWIRVGNEIEVIYWINGMAFKSSVTISRKTSEPTNEK